MPDPPFVEESSPFNAARGGTSWDGIEKGQSARPWNYPQRTRDAAKSCSRSGFNLSNGWRAEWM
jgi:hypothetical protein